MQATEDCTIKLEAYIFLKLQYIAEINGYAIGTLVENFMEEHILEYELMHGVIED